MEKRVDPLTGEEFVPRRSNQKFATAKNKSVYNNRIATRERWENAKLDKLLLTNKRILDKMIGDKKELTVSMDYLSGKGYSFKVINHIEVIDTQSLWCVYKYILRFDNQKRTVKISVNDRY